MKIGFIGTGNMGTSLIKGIINSKQFETSDINIFDPLKSKAIKLSEDTGVNIKSNNVIVAKESTIIILSIKPIIYNNVLNEIKDYITDDKIIVIIAPGITVDYVRNIIKKGKIVRTIPNTPALIGEGITAISFPNDISENERKVVKEIFKSCGEIVEINEELIDAAMAVSSCSPAFVYIFIEAMADAGVALGLSRDISYKLASKAVSGSGSMVLKTGYHPAYLKDMVTSPGGTTIQGVRTLEKYGMRSAIFEAIISSYEKVKKNGK